MHTPGAAASASGDATAPDPLAADARVLAENAVHVLRAGHELFQAEVATARGSLQALAIGALLAPVLLLGLWFSALALLLIGLHAAGLGWLAAGLLTCAVQILLLWTLLRAARRWASDLSLPRSRAFLLRLTQPQA